MLHLPLPKGSGADEYFEALNEKALPFLLDDPPDVLLICAGYDALDQDPLASVKLAPSDFGASVEAILAAFPRERVALGLEGGYLLDAERGMPAAVVATCEALVAR